MTSETKEVGWIDWAGGECPVDRSILVQVKFRDGYYSVQQPGATAGYWDGNGSGATSSWKHLPDEGHSDIIAYRVVQS